MKKKIFLSIFMAFSAIFFVAAQDLDKILDTYFETIGQERLLKVSSIQATGKVMMMGMESPAKISSKRPDKILIEIEIQGNTIIQAYDGTNAWMINPLSGSAAPIDITGPEADGMIESADMDGMLWNYKEKGHQLELDGTEEMDGSEVFVLKMTKKNGNIDYYYMDSESFVVLKMKSKVISNGSEIEVETLLSNYQDVGGYIMPLTTEQRFGGQTGMTIMMEEVNFDVELDDAIFSKPSDN